MFRCPLGVPAQAKALGIFRTGRWVRYEEFIGGIKIMSGNTTHYGLIKPVVGGSDNEWGGNLNDDLDWIDELLGGDRPINGIDIDSGTIDGGAIEGIIGDGDNEVEIHADTVISGKVKRLEGMDDPDGIITNCDVTTRELAVTESITEQVKLHSPTDDITFKAKDGTMHYLSQLADEQEITLIMTSGQAITLMLDWDDPENRPTSMVWNNAIRWVGGSSPDIVQGTNIIQLWCVNFGVGDVIFGAGAGAATA